MSRDKKFSTVDAAKRLILSMQVAVNNMIDEIKRPVDQDSVGSARKAELQSIKQTAVDCKELILEMDRLEQFIRDMEETGKSKESVDYGAGFAEKYSKS